jgi:hypothetical protein
MKNLLTVLFAALALLVAPAGTMGQTGVELNDSQEPGSVLVFPKFLRGRVTTPDQGVLATTEIEISATCPRGATCTDGQTVILRAHWVCPGALSSPCRETDFTLRTTVRGSLFFNPENIPPANASVPIPPCSGGYLIAWVVNTAGQPIKFDGLIGDAIIREGPDAAGAYNAIPIQAVSALATGALVSLGESGALVFDGLDAHYKAVTGTVIGTVRYNRVFTPPTQAPIVTSLTLLTLDVRSNDFNFPTFVDLDFFTSTEVLLSTFTTFVCWNEIALTAIDPNLVETFMGRKGLVQSAEAEKVAIFGIDDKAGPVTLIALIDTREFTLLPSGAPTLTRGYIYSTYNDSRPVPTSFVPR